MTDPAAVGHLLRCIDEYQGGAVVGYALKILPYLALRSAELRGGRWSEIDLDKALWTIPASRQKNPKDGGGMKMRIAHTVPLPTQAVRLFRELHLLTGCGELCFPGGQSASRCISDMALLNGVRRMGSGKGEMTIHGFRAMLSTILNEKKLEWGFDGDIIVANSPTRSKMPSGTPTTMRPLCFFTNLWEKLTSIWQRSSSISGP